MLLIKWSSEFGFYFLVNGAVNRLLPVSAVKAVIEHKARFSEAAAEKILSSIRENMS